MRNGNSNLKDFFPFVCRKDVEGMFWVGSPQRGVGLMRWDLGIHVDNDLMAINEGNLGSSWRDGRSYCVVLVYLMMFLTVTLDIP